MTSRIAYQAGYKYQLVETYVVTIPLTPSADIRTHWLSLTRSGILTIRCGYAWDGPSWPAIPTRNFMRGSLVHDALYQLIREGCLPPEVREAADHVLRVICLEDGMSRLRAWWVHTGLRWGGGPAADPTRAKPVLHAPKST